MKHVIGIDPGTNGGIAVIDTDGNVVEAVRMPDTPRDILDFLKKYSADSFCLMENVGNGMPGQSSKATATFARHNGHLEMALLAVGIPSDKVTPQKWEKSYQLGNSREYTKTQWKNRLKARAQMLFPAISSKITLATCDALLIASYALNSYLKKGGRP